MPGKFSKVDAVPVGALAKMIRGQYALMGFLVVLIVLVILVSSSEKEPVYEDIEMVSTIMESRSTVHDVVVHIDYINYTNRTAKYKGREVSLLGRLSRERQGSESSYFVVDYIVDDNNVRILLTGIDRLDDDLLALVPALGRSDDIVRVNGTFFIDVKGERIEVSSIHKDQRQVESIIVVEQVPVQVTSYDSRRVGYRKSFWYRIKERMVKE
ncbi:MAG: hypothetical protein ABIH41_07340 [Nanoarchaeota archaeon]